MFKGFRYFYIFSCCFFYLKVTKHPFFLESLVIALFLWDLYNARKPAFYDEVRTLLKTTLVVSYQCNVQMLDQSRNFRQQVKNSSSASNRVSCLSEISESLFPSLVL